MDRTGGNLYFPGDGSLTHQTTRNAGAGTGSVVFALWRAAQPE